MRDYLWRQLLAHVPILLVLLSLCWLALLGVYVPYALHTPLRELSQTLEPANRAATDLQLALSTEAAGTRAFLLTGDAQFVESFQAARAARRRAYTRLVGLSGPTAPGLADTLAETDAELRAADELLDALFAGRITREAYLAELPDQHRRFTNISGKVADLHHGLTTATAARRERIDKTLRAAGLLSLAGVLLGIVASFSVGWLNVRERSLARRERDARLASEKGHADAEARRLQLHRVTDRWTRLIRGFSHDLKNPLGAADGYLSMLEKGRMSPLTQAQQHAVGKSRHNLHTAIALTRDLMELARVEAAELDIRPVPMNLCEVVAGVVDDYRAQAAGKGLVIDTELPDPPVTVQSDPARVGQILGNMVNNAINYTPSGAVTIRVGERNLTEGAEGTTCAVVDVLDTGPGIPREHQQRIFMEFERLDTAGAPGTGVGLAISQRLAVMLGGTVTVESEPGHGATFTLWLPTRRPADTHTFIHD